MSTRDLIERMDDGAQIHVRVHAGDGTSIVLLHDLDCSMTYWDAVVDRLRALDQRLQIVLLDLRGHGASTVGEEPSRKRMLKDLKRVLRALDIEAPLIAGHGWGADLALATDLAGAVVAINPLFGRAPAPFAGDVERPEGMMGAVDETALRSALHGVAAAKPLRRHRRDAPALLAYSGPLDGEAVDASEVSDVVEHMRWQEGSRHLPIEVPNAVAALLWSWMEEVA